MQRGIGPIHFKRLVAAFLLALMTGTLAGCDLAPPTPQPPGPALTLPHTVTEITPLRLVLTQDQDRLVFTLECSGTGAYTGARVAIDVKTTRDYTNTSSYAVQAGICPGATTPAGSSSLIRLSDLQAGDELDVILGVQTDSTGGGPVGRTQTIAYRMGADSTLHEAGAGALR